MTNYQSQRIQKLMDSLLFSDKTSVQSRSSEIIQNKENIGFSIDITNIDFKEAENIRQKAINIIQEQEGIQKVSIVLTSAKQGAQQSKSNQNMSSKPKLHIEGARKILVIASGKGGVGKSTVTALFAHKLRKEGKRVGIIDADIYGPSIPNIFGLSGKPQLDESNNRMTPLENYGIYVNSIGFLADPESAISWRGPMVSKALYQLLSLTNWSCSNAESENNKLDYLLVDTPPGTGDIHLSLLQNYIIDGVIMVVTPQKIAEIDVARALGLYKKFNIPIQGIIENMSYYMTEEGKKIEIFSGDSGNILANKYHIPLLARIAIDPALSYACDHGESLEKFTSFININLE